MILLAQEALIPLRDAPKHLPSRPGGKRLHVSAIYRWVTKGVGGVVLESVRIGGTTYTSLEALQRFAQAQNRGRSAATPVSPAVVRPSARHRHRRAVAAELATELGLSSKGAGPR